jgi:4-amino-4-deoxy-L-arabinose transferase-like glycosyltransferase
MLIALIAFAWEPEQSRRRRTAAIAFALAALCPFTAIYVGAVLTETLTIFFALAATLAATYAIASDGLKRSMLWWACAGLSGGMCVLVRPDAGLFVGATGLTLVLAELLLKRREPADLAHRIGRIVSSGAILTAAFVITLAPWTIRNERVFHVFQPLAPAHAEMPGEFVPRGYYTWVKTWIDDGRYVEPVLWTLNDQPIDLEEIPNKAFDSADERAKVGGLLERYNHPPGVPVSGEVAANSSADTGGNNPQTDEADEGDESDDTAAGDGEEQDAPDQSDVDEKGQVLMTPEIDQGFAQIAHERVERDPVRYYLWLPIKRAVSLWFDTHSQYYPFEGELFPLSDLDEGTRQQVWLPIFTALTWVCTILAFVGAWALIKARSAWAFVLLACLMTLPRLIFFATLENPEPRYVVELFVFTSILGAIAISWLPERLLGTTEKG